jgi:hypothetical protein
MYPIPTPPAPSSTTNIVPNCKSTWGFCVMILFLAKNWSNFDLEKIWSWSIQNIFHERNELDLSNFENFFFKLLYSDGRFHYVAINTKWSLHVFFYFHIWFITKFDYILLWMITTLATTQNWKRIIFIMKSTRTITDYGVEAKHLTPTLLSQSAG